MYLPFGGRDSMITVGNCDGEIGFEVTVMLVNRSHGLTAQSSGESRSRSS